MQHSGFDLFGLTYVPEVFTQVTAGTASNVHLPLILVVTAGAFPFVIVVNDDLSVIAAFVAIVRLSVELRILDVIVDETNYILQCLQVMTHIGYLNVGDASAGGDLLELAFEGELRKGVDILANVNVIGVGVIALIGYVLDGTEPFFVDTCKTVAERLRRSTVKSEADIGLTLPTVSSIPQMLHDLNGKFLTLRLSVGNAGH